VSAERERQAQLFSRTAVVGSDDTAAADRRPRARPFRRDPSREVKHGRREKCRNAFYGFRAASAWEFLLPTGWGRATAHGRGPAASGRLREGLPHGSASAGATGGYPRHSRGKLWEHRPFPFLQNALPAGNDSSELPVSQSGGQHGTLSRCTVARRGCRRAGEAQSRSSHRQAAVLDRVPSRHRAGAQVLPAAAPLYLREKGTSVGLVGDVMGRYLVGGVF